MTVKELKKKLDQLIKEGDGDCPVTVLRNGEREIEIIEVDNNVVYHTMFEGKKKGRTVLLMDR